MPRLTYRPAALADLDSIYDFIEPENPRRALSFVDDIRTRCRTLCTYPQLGINRDDLGDGPGCSSGFRHAS
jgi:toxin ParE1/3/4